MLTIKNKTLLILLLFAISCKTTEQRHEGAIDRYGYIKGVEYTKSNIELYAKKWGIEPHELYFLDTKAYTTHIINTAEENKRLAHDFSQWHQLLVFDKEEKLLSYQLNCRTKVEYDDWNYNVRGTFDSYPPMDNSLKNFNEGLRLSEISAFYINKDGVSLKDEEIGNSEITIIAHWSIYYGRQSENMINTIKEYKEANEEKNIRFVFVNNDSMFN